MERNFKKIRRISGSLKIPGDKSIAHRALFFSSLAKGNSEIHNLPLSEDLKSTITCLRELGIKIKVNNNIAIVYGNGFNGYKKPSKSLYAGNSGTTARLLAGILSIQAFQSKIEGDESLSKRPMIRIVEPLKYMGANIKCSPSGTLPIIISPSKNLKPIDYILPVASAQLKGALILAGIHLEKVSKITEQHPSRDHTERMLNLKKEIVEKKTIINCSKRDYPLFQKYIIPGDISSAAFFIIATLLVPDSKFEIENISLNPTRMKYIELLKKMGAQIETTQLGANNSEPFGKLSVKSSRLNNVNIPVEWIPLLIDEIPALAVAGIFADGKFTIKGAKELRVKETDRINAICTNFYQLGLDVKEFDDGFEITGNIKKENPVFNSFGDHRIAMAFSILSSLMNEGGTVQGIESVSVSHPKFLEQLESISEYE